MNTITWLCIISRLSLVYSQDWCDAQFDCIIEGKPRKHIMCEPLPKHDICKALCVQPKSQMLSLHNDARDNITTYEFTEQKGLLKACDMSEVRWDDRLAMMAQRLASSCLLNINTCRATDRFKEVGQSVETIMQTDTSAGHGMFIAEVATMFSGWMNSFYTAQDSNEVVSNYKNGTWARGSQIFWADTKMIGCSVASYKLIRQKKVYHALICNYGPMGNIPGEEMYPTAECNPPVVYRDADVSSRSRCDRNTTSATVITETPMPINPREADGANVPLVRPTAVGPVIVSSSPNKTKFGNLLSEWIILILLFC